MESREGALRLCYKYVDTAAFFSVFSEKLSAAEILVEVERDFGTPGGGIARPDFVILERKKIVDALEHKASLPNPDQALLDLGEVHTKYSKLENEGVNSSPLVTLLYPIEKQDIIDEIAPELSSGLHLCGYDQVTKDTELRFRPKGQVRNERLNQILAGPPIVYQPEIVRSKYKFIRASPPTIYTAFELWRMFPLFQSVRTAHEPSHVVNLEQLTERARVFYPPWIRNNQQINSRRVRRALQFLDSIDFIDWKRGRSDIVVYRNRGRRSGDLLAYFSERWASLKPARGRRGKIGAISDDQTSISDFP